MTWPNILYRNIILQMIILFSEPWCFSFGLFEFSRRWKSVTKCFTILKICFIMNRSLFFMVLILEIEIEVPPLKCNRLHINLIFCELRTYKKRSILLSLIVFLIHIFFSLFQMLMFGFFFRGLLRAFKFFSVFRIEFRRSLSHRVDLCSVGLLG